MTDLDSFDPRPLLVALTFPEIRSRLFGPRNRKGPSMGSGARVIGGLLAVLAIFVGLPALWGFFTSFESTDGGHIAVVRNGGWFDNTSIRQVLPANSPRTSIGLWSSMHEYPTSERYYDITPDGGQTLTSDAFSTPTKDGVAVGLKARFNFKLDVTDIGGDASVIRAFDNNFGVRQFTAPPANPGDSPTKYYPYEGDPGFEAFLSTLVKPVIEATLRQQIGNVNCEELYSSCALVQNPNAQVAAATATTSNSATIQKIQDAIDAAFLDNVNSQLGGKYFTAVKVSITGVRPPDQVTQKIADIQTARAGVALSTANAAQAAADAQANINKQNGYNACAVCGQIDLVKAQGDALAKLPPSVTVYAPGGGSGINITPK